MLKNNKRVIKYKKLAAAAGAALFLSAAFMPCMVLAEGSDANPMPSDAAVEIVSQDPSPSENEAPSPQQSDVPSPVESQTPSPSESAVPLPSESEAPSPSESETPSPSESESPSPSASDDEDISEYEFFSAMPMVMTAKAAVQDTTTVRIKLSIGSVSSLSIKITGEYRLRENNNAVLAPGNYTLTAGTSSVTIVGPGINAAFGSVTLLRTAGQALGSAYITQQRSNGTSYNYLGDMAYSYSSAKIVAINHVNIENYLYGVVGYEMSNSWPLEALKAQAVCARGYAKRSLRPSQSYDMTDTASDQVYYGYNSTYGNVINAVDSTAGQVMTYNGSIVYAYYSASNGGQTELPGNAWGGGASENARYPYLVQKDDKYDLENTASSVQIVKIPANPASVLSQSMVEITGCKVSCNVRNGPSTSGTTVIGQAPLGAKYIKTGVTGEWYQVQYTKSDGSTVTAYISKDFIKEIPAGSGMFVYSNAAVSDIQSKAFNYCVNNLKLKPYNNAATSVKIDSINSVTNGTQRWPGTGSRCYVTAIADVTVSCATNSSGALTSKQTFKVTINLMNSSSSGYVNSHEYLSSSLRMRGVEKASDGWNIVCRRYGHGVGMSQRGAQTMASKYGFKYADILKFYFPGIVIMNGSTVVVNEDYSINSNNDGMVTHVNENTDYQTFVSGVQKKIGQITVTVTDINGKKKTSGKIVTGDKVSYSLNGKSYSYSVVIYGDVNCSGDIGLADLLAVQKHILGSKKLSGVQLNAADVSKDGTADILDLLKIQKHLLGSSPIVQ